MSPAGLAQALAAHGAAWALGTLLKGTVLLVALFLAEAALRRASAGLRHLVWSGGIVAVLLLPLVSLVLPWRLPVVRVPAVAGPAAASRAPAAGVPDPAPRAASRAVRGDAAATPATAQLPVGPTVRRPPSVSWAANAGWLVGLWGAGVVLVLLRLLRGAVLVRRVRRRAEALSDPAWTRPLVEAADRLGLAREPRLLVSDAVLMPILCGLRDPAIVLPAGARHWSAERRRAVLCHELAHVRRSDLAVTVLSRVGCALYWFHPLFWAAARRLRVESERACDDLVLNVGTRPSDYADHLLQIACGAGRERTPATALPMAERREFEGRMLAILERDARRSPPTVRHAAAFGVLGLLVVVPLAAVGSAPAPAAAPGPTASLVREDRAGAGSAVAPVATRSKTGAVRAEGVLGDAAPPGAPGAAADAAAAETALGGGGTDSKSAAADSVDPRTVAALLVTLEDPVPAVREEAAYALGRLEAVAAVTALGTRLLRDGAAAVREMAAWSLGQIGDRAATLQLASSAAHDESEAVRAMAVWALGQLGDADALPGLVAVLGDGSAEVRGRAAWAIGTVGPHHAPPALVAALRDPSSDVQLRAAWALGQIEDPAAVPALAAALASPASEVRRAALWALGRMEAPAAREALVAALADRDPEVRSRAARALGGSRSDPWPWPWPMPLVR